VWWAGPSMLSPTSNPANGSQLPATATKRSPTQLALDNLIRRELRVGDPRNPEQVAKALLDRYKGDRRAAGIVQEAQGLPFLRTAPVHVPAAADNTATSIDLKQAMQDVDKDLNQLAGNNLLKDISAEIEGWSDAIRSACAEGTEAARFGIDPRNRDRAFGVRRTLGDYARLARLVGTLTPSSTHEFRSLATSVDEVCAVILVMLGESMANNGFAGGRYLLQAPFTEMQSRRDSCMHALQNLLGSLTYTQAANEWPRGIDAYRRLFDALEAQGQGDLRALMTEQELGRVMDGLVSRAAHGSSEGLRALGSTAQVDLNRVYRLINFGYRLVDPESPPLTSFLESLRLFADGFGQAGGSRLLRIARPPIVFYGLYGSDEELPSDRRLVQLTIARGRLAGQLDCFARCGCDPRSVACQIVLDKVLYGVDRAIDLYAVGQTDLGLPEIRASAYAYVIDAVAAFRFRNETDPALAAETGLLKTLAALGAALRPDIDPAPDWEVTAAEYTSSRLDNIVVPGSSFRFTDVLHQELCLQHAGERRWEALIGQIAPGCLPPRDVFGPGGHVTWIYEHAMGEDGIKEDWELKTDVNGVALNAIREDCGLDGPDIPPHFETSLASLVNDRASNGES
jgi:hypothetical protein